MQTASPTRLKIKKFGEHAHKPNAVNYKNTYKSYFLSENLFIYSKNNNIVYHTRSFISVLPQFDTTSMIRCKIIPPIHAIYFLQQHSLLKIIAHATSTSYLHLLPDNLQD